MKSDKKENKISSNEKTKNEQENVISEENTEAENNAAETESENNTVPKKTFKDIVESIADYFTQNNPFAVLIGLFLIFSSAMMIKGYNGEQRIRPMDDWQRFSEFSDMGFVIRGILIIFILLAVLRKVLSKHQKINWAAIDSGILASGVLMFGVSALWRFDKEKVTVSIAVISVCSLILLWFFRSEDMKVLKRLPKYVPPLLTGLMAVGVCCFIIVVTLCKHNGFRSSTYDIGIFTQMYHSMITDFSLVTTCEREEAVSHFAVHFSPIYYVLYPFYLIWPSAKTLLVAQGILIASGVFPLYLICRKYNLSGIVSTVFCSVYTFSAAVVSPCFYDFHENVFLPPLIMWLFYAIEKDKTVLMYIMAALTLMVKEDAALYILSIALYVVFSRKNVKHGSILFVSTGIIFVTVLKLLASGGEGAMTSRTFHNVMVNYDGGLGELIKTAIQNPVYFISECFTEEKLTFMITMLLPLLFMPFITRKVSRMFLVVPFIVLNLLSGYVYSHDLDFQYVLGPATLLIYAALINVADFKPETAKRIIPIMAAASVFMFTGNVTKRIYYYDYYNEHKETCKRKETYLNYIPEDASLLCSNFLLPHAANRKEVYMADEYNYEKRRENYDFVALETTFNEEWMKDVMSYYEAKGYTVFAEYESDIIIYKSPDYVVK